MTAAEWAAWVGAFGAVANAVALVVIERRKRTPDASLKLIYSPAVVRDTDWGGRSAGIELVVHTSHDLTIVEAGVERIGLFRRLRRYTIEGFAACQGQEHSVDLPWSTGGSPWLRIRMSRETAVAAGVDPSETHRGWARTAGGVRMYSYNTLTFMPAEVDEF